MSCLSLDKTHAGIMINAKDHIAKDRISMSFVLLHAAQKTGQNPTSPNLSIQSGINVHSEDEESQGLD